MFDYLAVLISVILGVALTHIVTGYSHLIQRRSELKLSVTPLVWSVAVLVYVLAVWWGMFWWKHLDSWSFQQFLYLVVYAVAMFLLATMVFPHEIARHPDLPAWFEHNRRWFFALLIMCLLLDIPETLEKSVDGLRGVPREYRVFIPCALGLAGLGMELRRPRAQLLIACAWLAVLAGYIGLTVLDRIDAG